MPVVVVPLVVPLVVVPVVVLALVPVLAASATATLLTATAWPSTVTAKALGSGSAASAASALLAVRLRLRWSTDPTRLSALKVAGVASTASVRLASVVLTRLAASWKLPAASVTVALPTNCGVGVKLTV